jgi:multiple antibiotic resistance protein
MAAGASADTASYSGVVLALAAVMILTFILLFLANELSRALGVTAQRVLMRVFGILLAAIAVQAVFDGFAGSGLFDTARG